MYHLYVVMLDESVWSENRFRWHNLQRHPGRPCVYVGQTARTPEERFAQHRAGRKANPWVRRYGVRLLDDLTGPVDVETRAEAEAREAELARRLRRKGWAVWSN